MGDSSRKSRYFRVLIIGRANSGKTTILRAVCGSEDEPEVYPLGSKLPNHRGRRLSFFQSPLRFWRDKPAASLSPTEERGIHNIKDQLLFSSNPGFIFHDSQGFEMGSAAELEVVQNFIKERIEAGKESFQEQLHAIWYCIPTDSTRPFTTAERIFFDECNTGEEVPVVVIFTKCDSLLVQAFRKLRDEGLSADDARKQAPGRVDQWFDEIYTPFIRERRYPPAGEVRLQDMHENKHEQVQLAMRSLISKTNNVELCMISAIESGHITETVNDVLKAGITSFPKEYKYHKFEKFLWGIIQWFAYFWVCCNIKWSPNTLHTIITFSLVSQQNKKAGISLISHLSDFS
ncbi:hypothetical protein BOTBODRAFT_516917 [Botryobasidium botryosum FD-172 SS1]|uniref:G domain-containing protein n=1 Tax=Botryobasidium botryosum (strain FD-172 SS1) TaxID=930990 RepID=A0A067N4B7_BOTB1|nr:hypothetical protein BOTBODRAFT_516917 [Botryobasidium botryosum FD-172 SS1]